MITLRHFHDENMLKTYGHDGPLKPGQDSLIATTTQQIVSELQKSNKEIIRLLYTEKTRRISDTAYLVTERLSKFGINIVFQHDTRLEVMDQGDLILPDNYQDGDWFTPLDVAWDVICDESYHNFNLFYRFGDHLNGKYPILKDSFSRTGESMGWSLMHKYSLIYDLIHNKFIKNNELLLIAAQSDLPLLLMEFKALEGKYGITPENLPYKSWKIYKSGLQEEMYDKHAIGDGNFDIPMGYIGKFDLSNFAKSGFDQIIKNAGLLLNKQYHEKK
jgi:hypothetical protein